MYLVGTRKSFLIQASNDKTIIGAVHIQGVAKRLANFVSLSVTHF